MNIINKRYGAFVVIEIAKKPEHVNNNKTYYLIRCDCGENKKVTATQVKTARVTCQKCKSNNSPNEVVRFKAIWKDMKYRCKEEGKKSKGYGDIGIKVEDSWHYFKNFYNDMFEEYLRHLEIHGEKNTTIDRIDVSKNYSKDNCRWATIEEQAKNRSVTIHTVIDGETYNTLKEVEEKFGIKYKTLQERYSKGLRGSELVAEVRNHNRKERKDLELVVNGVSYNNFAELQCDYPFVTATALRNRYDKGLRGELLVKTKEFYCTKEGKEIVKNISRAV